MKDRNRRDPDSESAEEVLEESIRDARRIIDHQIEFAKASDESNQKILRYNLLIFAAFTTLLAYSVQTDPAGMANDLINAATISATVFAASSIIIASAKFVSKVYGGFGDSPFLQLVALTDLEDDEVKIPVETDAREIDDETVEKIQGITDDFRELMLYDYQRGIRHNNTESVYRVVLHRRSIYLIVISIMLYGIGAMAALGEQRSFQGWGDLISNPLGIAALLTIVLGLIVLLNASYWAWKMNERERDDHRMVYDHYDPRPEIGWWHWSFGPGQSEVDDRDAPRSDGSNSHTDGTDIDGVTSTPSTENTADDR